MTRLRRWLVTTIAALSAILLSSRVDAASCTISTTPVSFGVYDVFSGTATDSTGTITFKCTGNASVTINLNKGTSTTFTPRVLTSGSNTINYNLFTDASRGTIWGDATGGTSNYVNANPANNQNIVVTVYGRITSGQDVSAGSYSDTITATINF
jgi:spore coat protein U-like protein